MKRLFDIALSLALLVALVVPMGAISLAIWLHDRGPVFFRQTRIGKDLQPFGMLKFRTMVVNADKIGSYQTAENDTRITPVGAVLRKTSLDELPQILNVLAGEMSFVGPRPDVPEQQALYAPEDWVFRHSVRPGITGLAQASGRSHMDFETRTRHDLDYVRNASFLFDLKVLFRTFRTLRKGV